jgi:hypothetical protein
MHSVDLVYVKTISCMLEHFTAEYQSARASQEIDRACRLIGQITELRARRDRMMALLFGFDPVIGSD